MAADNIQFDPVFNGVFEPALAPLGGVREEGGGQGGEQGGQRGVGGAGGATEEVPAAEDSISRRRLAFVVQCTTVGSIEHYTAVHFALYSTHTTILVKCNFQF